MWRIDTVFFGYSNGYLGLHLYMVPIYEGRLKMVEWINNL